MFSDVRCLDCEHLPHPDRECLVKRVDGPPSSLGGGTSQDYRHIGRTVTPCGCTVYLPAINGVEAFHE